MYKYPITEERCFQNLICWNWKSINPNSENKIFLDPRLQKCHHSCTQSQFCEESYLICRTIAVGNRSHSRRGKIWWWGQGRWWKKLSTLVQSRVQKDRNSPRSVSLIQGKFLYWMIPIHFFTVSTINFIALPVYTKNERLRVKG